MVFITCIKKGNDKNHATNQSLVGSVVIGAELGKDDSGSIPCNCN
jgi:hypothetical protein